MERITDLLKIEERERERQGLREIDTHLQIDRDISRERWTSIAIFFKVNKEEICMGRYIKHRYLN